MRNRHPLHTRLNPKSLLLLGCLFSSPSWANYDPTVSDFALFIQYTDMDWAYPATSRQTTTTRLLAVWHEYFSPSLKGGLRLGYLDLSQASNPLPSAQNSTGYSLGFDIHALLVEQRMLHQVGVRPGALDALEHAQRQQPRSRRCGASPPRGPAAFTT